MVLATVQSEKTKIAMVRERKYENLNDSRNEKIKPTTVQGQNLRERAEGGATPTNRATFQGRIEGSRNGPAMNRGIKPKRTISRRSEKGSTRIVPRQERKFEARNGSRTQPARGHGGTGNSDQSRNVSRIHRRRLHRLEYQTTNFAKIRRNAQWFKKKNSTSQRFTDTTCARARRDGRLPGSNSTACFRFRDQGSGFRVQGSGFRVQGSGFRIQGLGFRVWGSGFKVQGSGIRV